MEKKRTLTSGFSLVEVLLAMLILGVGILGLMSLMIAILANQTNSRSRQTAVCLAKGLLDRVEAEAQIKHVNTNYGLPAPTGYASAFGAAATTQGTLRFDTDGKPTDEAHQIFTVNWRRLAAKGGTPNCSEYRVDVQWASEMSRGNTPVLRTVSMSRLVVQ